MVLLKSKKEDSLYRKSTKTVRTDSPVDSFKYKEGGFGWVVVICSGYCLGFLIGMINNYALLYNELAKVYKSTENHIFYSGKIKP